MLYYLISCFLKIKIVSPEQTTVQIIIEIINVVIVFEEAPLTVIVDIKLGKYILRFLIFNNTSSKLITISLSIIKIIEIAIEIPELLNVKLIKLNSDEKAHTATKLIAVSFISSANSLPFIEVLVSKIIVTIPASTLKVIKIKDKI